MGKRLQRRASPPGPSANVLVVEDDETVAEVVTRYLEREGHRVQLASDGLQALAILSGPLPDLVVLDLMLPRVDGLEIIRRLRERSDVPVIVLSARGDEDDRLLGLQLGADDYITKPFSPRELVARVQAVLRRSGAGAAAQHAEPLEIGEVRVDPTSREAFVRNLPVALTVREFDLLTYFMRHPMQAFRRETLLEEVWGYTFGDTSTVTVHVRRLREKIEADPAHPTHVQTVWGVGYRFSA